MSFISYAQNFEDVMLWRALKHVDNGFYIDIGAQDPLVDSVSMAFYEHGWRGCHVEPTTQYSTKLRESRPDEMVLQLAIGNDEGLLSFFEFDDTGLSTSDKAIALEHEARGFRSRETTVPVISLDALFNKIGDRDIHWLKVDVEGAERSVLESWKLSPVRPWVLVIESTKPMTQIESFEEWEHLVLNKGYVFAYFDGLNRFYISADHPELRQAYTKPPNIFDGFMLSGIGSQPFYKRVESRAQQAETKAQQAETKAQQAETKAQQAEKAVIESFAQLQAVYGSTSWRVTKPLRAIKCIFGGDFSIFQPSTAAVVLKAKQMFRPMLASSIGQVFYRPKLRKSASSLLKKIPWLHQHLLRIAVNSGVVDAGGHPPRKLTTAHEIFATSDEADLLKLMTPRTRQIYLSLKISADKKKKRVY